MESRQIGNVHIESPGHRRKAEKKELQLLNMDAVVDFNTMNADCRQCFFCRYCQNKTSFFCFLPLVCTGWRSDICQVINH